MISAEQLGPAKQPSVRRHDCQDVLLEAAIDHLEEGVGPGAVEAGELELADDEDQWLVSARMRVTARHMVDDLPEGLEASGGESVTPWGDGELLYVAGSSWSRGLPAT